MALVTVTMTGLDLAGRSSWLSRPMLRWAKVATAGTVSLAKEAGYALTADFLQLGKTITLHPGQYLVSCVEGRRAYDRQYSLHTVNEQNDLTLVDDRELQRYLDAAHLPEEVQAKCKNSWPYTYAAYIWTKHATGEEAGGAPLAVAASDLEQLWTQLRALPEVDQVEIRNRLLKEL